ncbi:MAG: response regulator [Magnetococcales bacterium]|nr:response regulator [Magnetococcales bacterium]
MNPFHLPSANLFIISDNPVELRLLSSVLAEAGHSVRTALDGTRAVTSLKAQPADLILLDLHLSGEDGYEVCRRLKIDNTLRPIPILFLANLSETTDRLKGFNAGGVDYISKPLHPQEILLRVSAQLGLQHMRRQLEEDRIHLEKRVRERTAELLEANLQLRELHGQLRRAKEQAEAASRFKSAFLSSMSHEIRTPMNVVIGMGDLLLESELTEEQQGYLGKIQRAGHTLLELINQILDLSKIEAGQFTLLEETVDFGQVVGEVVELMRVLADKKGLRLDYLPEANRPRWLLADGLRLRQVLVNLIGNAVKFTERGGISLRESVTPDAAHLRLAVEDSGIGMKQEIVERLFQPFVQGDAGITRQFGGSGLGLALSRGLVDRMGGDIQVSSEPGKGSTFCITLPLRAAPPPALQATPEPLTLSECPPLRILLVEDSEDNQLLITTFLKKTPHTLSVAWNGEEALQRLKNEVFDLVFMDVQMPILDGYSATRAYREWEIQEGGGRHRLIVALTAHALEGEAQRSREAGCDFYLSKPITKQRLLEVIRQLGCRLAVTDAGPTPG